MVHAVALGWDVAALACVLALAAGAVAFHLWRVTRRAGVAVAELHASRERYRALAARLPDVSILVFDRDLRFTLVEGAALARHGWRRDELEGRLLGEAVPGGQTASCGIAEWDGEETGEALTARADAALYMAKRAGACSGRARVARRFAGGCWGRAVVDPPRPASATWVSCGRCGASPLGLLSAWA